MKIFNHLMLSFLLAFVFPTTAWSSEAPEGDIHLNSYNPNLLQASPYSDKDYTVLDAAQYYHIVKESRDKIRYLIKGLQAYPSTNANARIAYIVRHLSGIPYIFTGAMGEGDWQPTASIYRPGAVHVRQDPVYRLDGLDCQTFVQVAMALLYSKNLKEFDQDILKISYGAAGNPNGEITHYYNRNNFVDGDWNPINQHNGWLTDVTSQGSLAPYTETTSANITRQNWFLFQQKNLAANVRVLADKNGPLMAKRFMTLYSELNYPNFDTENVTIAYIPKEKIALQQADGSYQPNKALLNLIPTPAVIEIVRDVKKWNIGGKNIKDVIGSELNISHLGLLYRHHFKQGELIYHKTTCSYDPQHQKFCTVTPVVCEKDSCNELMFAHATDARPSGYFWYKTTNGNYTCSAIPPTHGKVTQCNRVEQQPLFNYLTDYQYGSYWYMNSPSLIGVHIERLDEAKLH